MRERQLQTSLVYCGKPFGSGAQFSFWQRSSLVIEVLSLFAGLGTDVHFSGDETGLQWKDFELQNVVEWRIGDVERSRRTISDARQECVAQHVQWHDEPSVH